jgi:hypothetical protein
MKKIRVLLAAVSLVWAGILAAAPPASAVVCIEEINSCCEDVVILGKTIVPIDCFA